MKSDGVPARKNGTEMSGPGLKKKLRSYADDSKFKGRATQKKGGK